MSFVGFMMTSYYGGMVPTITYYNLSWVCNIVYTYYSMVGANIL